MYLPCLFLGWAHMFLQCVCVTGSDVNVYEESVSVCLGRCECVFVSASTSGRECGRFSMVYIHCVYFVCGKSSVCCLHVFICRFSENVYCVRYCRCLYTGDTCWSCVCVCVVLHVNACIVRRSVYVAV